MEPKVAAALADLIEINGFDSDLQEIPVHLPSDRLIRVQTPGAA